MSSQYRVTYVWEGKVEVAKSVELREEEYLNQMGADGWELVAAVGVVRSRYLYLKRPKP
jgi:hypothetical protein